MLQVFSFGKRLLFAVGAVLALAGTAQAQVTVNSINLPTNIGRGQTVNVDIAWLRTSSAAAIISTPLPAQVQVQPPALPAGCVLNAGSVECTVPAGVATDTGTITFQVRGAALGGFNLTATATGGSNASVSSNVTSAGDLTVLKSKISPAGNPLAGQVTTFRLAPNIALGDDVPAGASIVVTDNLPGTSTDFNLTAFSTGGLAPTCNSFATANSTRTLTCTYNGPFTVAAFNASNLNVTGTPGNLGTFTNVGSIATGNVNYFDSDSTNNLSNLNYTVDPASDLQALGSFPAGGVLTDSSQTLTLIYRNNGPLNAPAGGTISTIIPIGFVVGALPGSCLTSGSGPWTITCTAGAVNNGNTQSFGIPLTMPSAPISGNFPVTVTPPSGFGDANLANNSVNVPYNVVAPSADLQAQKSKNPGGPQPEGTTVTTTLTVNNVGTSSSAASYDAAHPLRIVDYLQPEEVSGGVVSGVSANWLCVVTPGVTPPPFVNAAQTTQVACETTDAGVLAIGGSRSVSFSTTLTLNGAILPVTLPNTACTGGRALTALGLPDTSGPQPVDPNTANDCVNDTANLVVTPVASGHAQVSLQKLSSVDNTNFFDAVGAAPTLAGDVNTLYWRMVVTTPDLVANPTQSTIPTLHLADTVPGRLSISSPGSPAPAYVTPAITVTTTPNTWGSCPNLASGNAGALACDFTDVPPGTTITIDMAVQRPLASGTLTNTATLSSPNAILSASAGGQLSDAAAVVVAPRVDLALTTKTVTPASPRVGEQVQFTITAQNLGPDSVSAAGQFTITDTLNIAPDASNVGYEVLSVSGISMDCTASNLAAGTISCTNTGAIARYTVRTITITARIKKPGGVLPATGNVYTGQTNTATVTLSGGACEYKTETVTNASVSAACNDAASTSNNSKTATFNVQVPAIDMKQRKERLLPVGQTAFGLGDQLHYRFRVQANGPSRAENVVMTDRLVVPGGYSVEVDGVGAFPRTVTALAINGTAAEAGYTLDAAKAGTVQCTQSAPNADVVCNLSSVLANNFLDPAKEVNFELLFNMTPTTATTPVSFGNRAFVCADETAAYESSGACSDVPATAGNNLAAVNDTVFPKNDLEVISKTTITPSPADINQPIQFNIVMRNNGPSTAVKMRLRDMLPTGLEWVNAGAYLPVASVNGGSAATLSGALSVSASVPANGTDNVCFISNGVTSLGNLTQQQQINCDISGNFPAGAGNTITLTLYARAKGGLYNGTANAPYLTNRTNTATILPGLDATGGDIAIDIVPGNNTATSVTQIRNASVSGRTFLDLNGNGDQNGSIIGADQGLGNVGITLTGTDLYGYAVSYSTITDNAALGAGSTRGDYLFTNLAPSNAAGYTITQTQPAGFPNGTPVPNTARAVRNGVSTGVNGPYAVSNTTGPATSVIAGVRLAGGGNAVQFDFPELQKPSISGFVYVDADNNGIKGGAEAGINGVTLTLIGCRTGPNGVIDTAGPVGAGPATCSGDDVAVNLTTTSTTDPTFGAGYYKFQLDEPGRYTVIQQVAQPVVGGAITLRGQTVAGSVDKITSAVGSNDGGTRGTVNATGNTAGGSAGVAQELATTVTASQIRDIVISDSSAVSVNNNFGETLPARVSGVVYTEKGIVNSNYTAGVDWPFPGMPLTLTGTDDLGQAVALSGSTDVIGAYSFTNLRPGTYQVVKTNPAGIVNEVGGAFPGKDAGNVTRGARVDDNTINAIALVSGAVVTETNFAVTNGPAPEAIMAAYVYVDRNRNHTEDSTEKKRLDGVTINLVWGSSCEAGGIVQTAKTDITGSVYFKGEVGKSYWLCQVQPAGYGNGNADGVPGSNGIAINDLQQGGSYGHSFGEWVASISGAVYEDFGASDALTNNGVRDGGERGIAGVPVTLSGRDITGAAVSLGTVTDASGNYVFDDLLEPDASGYTVTEGAIPTSAGIYADGKDTAGNASVAAGNATAVNDHISGIRLAAAERATGYNFGELKPGTLSGTVYLDSNGNGVRDSTEPGIAGVTVTLTGIDSNGQSVNRTQVTNANGQYRFEDLQAAGPAGYTVTEQLAQPNAPGTTMPTFNGATTAGTIAGVTSGAATPVNVVPSAVSGIALPAGGASVDNDFGEVLALDPDLIVTKSSNKKVFTEGGSAIYTIRVKNGGPSPTHGSYTVVDTLSTSTTPPKWTIEAVIGTGWTCAVSADKQQVSCDSSQVLAAGQEHAAPIQLTVKFAQGASAFGPLRNVVSVTGGGEPKEKQPKPGDTPKPCGAQPEFNLCEVVTPVQVSVGLEGHVWIDGVNRKVLDPNDKLLPAWIVEVYDVGSPQAVGKTFTELVRGNLPVLSTTTDARGHYQVCGLEPGTQYRVLFRDPSSRIAFPGVVTNEAGRVTGADYWSQVKTYEGFEVLQVTLPPAPAGASSAACNVTAPEQSLPLDPNGVVYDSRTRQPVPGATVTLVPEGNCPGYDPRLHIINYETYGKDAAGNPSMVTGSEGLYKFLLSGDPASPKSCQFRLVVKEPSGYNPPPSAIIPPKPALATPAGPGIHFVQPQRPAPSGSQDTSYHFEITLGLNHQEVFNNHIPLDPVTPGTLVLSKVGDRRVVEIGDTVLYTIRVRQTAGDPTPQVTVRDRLPAGFTLVRGTVRVNNAPAPDPQGGLGPTLAFNLGALRTGQEITLSYRVRVGVGAQQGDGVNRAQAFACAQVAGCLSTTSLQPLPAAQPGSEGQYRVQIGGGVFTSSACVAGKIFVDCNHNHVQDPEELGIPGVRLYLENGAYLVSDSEGKYSQCGLTSRSHVLKVDPATLPRGARLTTSSNRNLGDAGSLLLDGKNGELVRADFIEGSCSNPVLEQVKARRAQGEVRSVESERAGSPALRFDAKPVTAPRQATDGANQPTAPPRAVVPTASTQPQGAEHAR